jgi:Tfp pilus assembly protein PilF
MAKEFHPDRHFALSSEDIKSKLNEILAFITEAFNTLSDPDRRMKYDETHAGGKEEPADNFGTSCSDTAEAKFADGRAKMLHGAFHEAEQLFDEAIAISDSVPKFHYCRGLTLNRLENFKDASEEFKESVKLDPDKDNYHTALGFTFYKLGFNQRAKNSFRGALDISPMNEKAIEGLRHVDSSIGSEDTDEA